MADFIFIQDKVVERGICPIAICHTLRYVMLF